MRVEIIFLHARRVRQNYFPDAERGKLRPQTLQNFRPRHREQQINDRERRRPAAEFARQRNFIASNFAYERRTEWPVEQTDTNGIASFCPQNIANMPRGGAQDYLTGESYTAEASDLGKLIENAFTGAESAKGPSTAGRG